MKNTSWQLLAEWHKSKPRWMRLFPASQATCGGQLLSKGTPTLKMDVDSLPKEELNTQGLITRHQRFMALILPR